MTVSDPGAGQQQGRECDPRTCPGHTTGNGVTSGGRVHHMSDPYRRPRREPQWCDSPGHPVTCPCLPASPTPPARDSGRDEAREAVARWLWRQEEGALRVDRSWNEPGFRDLRRHFQRKADELLALPELDKLLRRRA